jgi:ATP-dependent DNA helicase RecG
LEKLQVMEKTDNGFEIAEADLRLRGPGELLGTAQTGIPSLGPGDLLRDASLMNEARAAALSLITGDPDLSQPKHKKYLEFVHKEESRLSYNPE